MSRKMMNNPDLFVDESLKGIIRAHGDFYAVQEDDLRALFLKEKQDKVAIVTGGGYGHLPLFLGYVGRGLCDGVAVGNVFTSPSCETIMNVSRQVNSGKGVLYLFGNYMGDSMNFEMAGEMLSMEGIETAIVKGSDDIASYPREQWTERRGIAGIYFLYKVAGAAADRGDSLEQVVATVNKAAERVATYGVAFSSCQLPGAAKPIFELPETDIEIGMGIHGEPGNYRVGMMTSAELAAHLIDHLLPDLSLTEGDEVAVMLNSLGATSLEEMYILNNDVCTELEKKGIKTGKILVNRFATSMEMSGASVSLMKLDDELKALLSAPAYSPFLNLV